MTFAPVSGVVWALSALFFVMLGYCVYIAVMLTVLYLVMWAVLRLLVPIAKLLYG